MQNKVINVLLLAWLINYLLACSHVEPSVVAKNSYIDDQKYLSTPFDTIELVNHLQQLSSDEFSGRKLGTQGNKMARSYILSALKRYNIPSFDQQYQHNFIHKSLLKDRAGQNIIALIEGSEFKQEYIVLTAHFDHLGIKAGNIYNGADDNASGTAALLVLGKEIVQRPLRYSVILLFTDAEEANLLGSKAFVKDYANVLPSIKLNVNLDMIAGNKKTTSLHYITRGINSVLDDNKYQEFNNFQHQSSIRIVRGFNRVYDKAGRNRGRSGWLKASDHGVFYRNKVPFIYFGVGPHNNYHTKNDTFENVNLDFYIKASQTIFQQILVIDHLM